MTGMMMMMMMMMGAHDVLSMWASPQIALQKMQDVFVATAMSLVYHYYRCAWLRDSFNLNTCNGSCAIPGRILVSAITS